MTFNQLALAAILPCFSSLAIAVEPLIIDDFTAGEGFGVVLSGSFPSDTIQTFDEGLPQDHTIGGSRRHRFQSCIQDGFMSVVHDTAAGAYLAGGVPSAVFCEGPLFEYGGDGAVRLSTDASSYNAVSVDLLHLQSGAPNPWYDPPFRVPTVLVWASSGIGSDDYASERASETITNHAAPRTLLLPFSKFTDSSGREQLDWSDIDTIRVGFGRIGQCGALGIDGFSFVYLPALDGDYDADGQIDALDHDADVSTFGSTVDPGTGADGNGDGIINAAAYTVWRDAVDLSVTMVPEPTALVGAMTITTMASMFRKKQ